MDRKGRQQPSSDGQNMEPVISQKSSASRQSGSKKRYYGLDKLKTICALLVVGGHTSFPGIVGKYYHGIAHAGIPVFLMISGYFFNRKKAGVQMQKIVRLLISANVVYLIWNIVSRMWKGYYDIDKYLLKVFTKEKLIRLLLFNETHLRGHLWYLFSILYVLIIVTAVCKWKHGKTLLAVLTPFLLLGDLLLGKYSLVFFHRKFPYIYVRNWLFVGIPYFTIGMLIRDRIGSIRENLKSHGKWKLELLIGVSIITTIFEKWLLVHYQLNSTREHYFSTTFLGIGVFLFFLLYANQDENWISRIGRNDSTWIYILHPIIITIFKTLKIAPDKKSMGVYSFLYPFIVFLITLAIVESMTWIRKFVHRK